MAARSIAGQHRLHDKALGAWTASRGDVGRALASSAKAVPLCVDQLIDWVEHRVTPPLQTGRLGKLQLLGGPTNISAFPAARGRRA